MKNKPKMIYIVSPSYSGSTLLTFLMANHSEISTVGELKATSMGDVSEYKCSCGEKILECGFWNKLKAGLHARGIPFSEDNFGTHFGSAGGFSNKLLSSRVRNSLMEAARMLLLRSGVVGGFNDILRKNKLLVDAVCELQGGSVFLDGSKDCNRLMYFVRSGLWDVKVVNLVREERGQLCSLMSREKTSMTQAIDSLIQTRQEQKRTLSYLHSDQYINVNYNELCRNTLSELNRIYEFVGIAKVDDAGLSKNNHHILGNSMRLSNVEEIRVDERWKELLTEDDLRIYAPFAGKINSILGEEVAAYAN